MQLPDAGYGEQQDFQSIQSGAPLAKAQSVGGTPAQASPQITGMGAPTQMPDTPVTAGAAMGAGPGMEALNLPQGSYDAQNAQDLRKYLPVLIDMASADDALPGMKQWVRTVIANLK
jgi:hypothetical protein